MKQAVSHVDAAAVGVADEAVGDARPEDDVEVDAVPGDALDPHVHLLADVRGDRRRGRSNTARRGSRKHQCSEQHLGIA